MKRAYGESWSKCEIIMMQEVGSVYHINFPLINILCEVVRMKLLLVINCNL